MRYYVGVNGEELQVLFNDGSLELEGEQMSTTLHSSGSTEAQISLDGMRHRVHVRPVSYTHLTLPKSDLV